MLYNINSTIAYPSYKDFNHKKKINFLTELNIKLIKFLIIDKRLKYNVKFFLKIKYLSKYGKIFNTFKSTCLLTGKNRFIFSYFNLNRSTLKYYLSCGYISGFNH